jgi:hypothetical protein
MPCSWLLAEPSLGLLLICVIEMSGLLVRPDIMRY